MADSGQFDSPKVWRSGEETTIQQTGGGHCAECEAMLADALDGTLATADQARLKAHTSECGPCRQLLAEARRGAAWLEMLRAPVPEPPAALLERILAETGRWQMADADQTAWRNRSAGDFGATLAHPLDGIIAAPAPGHAMPGAAAYGNVIPFRRRFAAAVRTSALGQIVLQPRLAMTSAMAFFSIALTMNLTGVRLRDLRVSDLRPSSIERDFYSADARVAQYYQGLRVVYELESRVYDLESANQDDDAPAAIESAPSNWQPNPNQSGGQTGGQSGSQAPIAQPGSAMQKAAPQPDRGQPEHNSPERKSLDRGSPDRKSHAFNPGTSLRDGVYAGLHPAVAIRGSTGFGTSLDASLGTGLGTNFTNFTSTRMERGLA